MTYEQAFEKIKERLKDADTSKLTGDFAIQVDLINKDCQGIFYVAYLNGVFEVQPYDYVDNYAKVALMFGDFTKLVEGKLNVDKAIADEKIFVTGDVEKVKELGTLVKKTPVKRAKKEIVPPATATPEKKVNASATKAAEKKATKKTAVKKTAAKETKMGK